MCFYYDSEASVYREIVRQAQKSHKCESCREVIEAGDLYIFGSGIFDHHPFQCKICSRCKATQIKIYEKELEEGCFGQEAWCSLVEVEIYCREEGFPMESKENGQIYLESLRVIQEEEKSRIKQEKKDRKKNEQISS